THRQFWDHLAGRYVPTLSALVHNIPVPLRFFHPICRDWQALSGNRSGRLCLRVWPCPFANTGLVSLGLSYIGAPPFRKAGSYSKSLPPSHTISLHLDHFCMVLKPAIASGNPLLESSCQCS